jgi:hypothetical protein
MSAAISDAPRHPPLLACQRDPDRWFDRVDRTDALAGCLQCPARKWCARQALSVRPAYGMWAGIWIDHNLPDVSHYLHAIAEASPSATPPPAPTTAPPSPVPAISDYPRPTRIPDRRASVPALITARSSGHCEILSPDCLLTSDGIVSRIPRRLAFELRDPAGGYVACRRCRAVVTKMEPRLARAMGYLVDARHDPGAVPFYWRQSRWMLLDSAGSALPAPRLQRPA